MNNKYKISMLSVAMATIVLLAMTAVAGVSAAQPAKVGVAPASAPGTSQNGPVQMTFVEGYNGHLWGIASVALDRSAALTWVDFGLAITGQPAVVWTGSADYTVVAPTASGIIAITTPDSGVTWSGPTTWPGTVLSSTGVAAISDQAGTTQVFYVDSASHHLMVDTQAPPGLVITQTDLGGMVYATPAATTVMPIAPPTSGVGATPASIVVIVKGTGGLIYEKTASMGGWSGYAKLHDGRIGLGAALATGPQFVDAGPTVGAPAGTVVLLVAGVNGHLYSLVSTDGGLNWALKPNGPLTTHNLNWVNAGGVCVSAPGASNLGATVVTLVAGADGNVWQNNGVPGWNAQADFSWALGIPGPG